LRQHDTPALDDEMMDTALAAQTRLSEPSVRVILLSPDDPLLQGDSPVYQPIRLEPDLARYLLGHSVAISDRRVVAALQDASFLPAIEKTAAVRGYYVLANNYRWHDGKTKLALSVCPILGVRIKEVHDV